jgi:endogenous inhibitor of DNA gyrase (YacG/DUF329 family)
MGYLRVYDCIECGKSVKNYNTSGKYCSNTCQKEHEFKTRVTEWKSGMGTIGKGTVKRYLTETDGYKCSVCEIDNWCGQPINLEIDHADGDPYNNHHSNLRLICPNCHSQTKSFKNRNKGNGRSVNSGKGWLLENRKGFR